MSNTYDIVSSSLTTYLYLRHKSKVRTSGKHPNHNRFTLQSESVINIRLHLFVFELSANAIGVIFVRFFASWNKATFILALMPVICRTMGDLNAQCLTRGQCYT